MLISTLFVHVIKYHACRSEEEEKITVTVPCTHVIERKSLFYNHLSNALAKNEISKSTLGEAVFFDDLRKLKKRNS